ncbi:DeoR faimly transcriptional regulator [Aquabacterium sp. NJ1]|uniref:HIT family protein n=1 Tax=Aquabacterium sp. NJ1 TaxID=1538295 RepID=UPI00052D78F5|nr:HIT family protein [Aquabacterium sp. NJ1]KGM41211.1 DeoR faimly transcriptional regulator [Aquabacterium sp. NJ1]
MGQLDTSRAVGCELCTQDGGILIVRTDKLRVIRALDEDHPAFYRVIWNDHVAEWTDLIPENRSHIMQTVAKVETVLREALSPTKINLASLGNVVPHLHWHVIARFDWDARWPAPVWAPKQREVSDAASRLALPLTQLDAMLARALQAG